jgi:hypothetical protein
MNRLKTGLIFGIFLIAFFAAGCLNSTDAKSAQETPSMDIQEIITNFEECIAAGYPAMESHPRQCMTAEGKTFVEVLDEPKSSSIGMPVPGFEGSDVVETIVVEDSAISINPIMIEDAKAVIVPPSSGDGSPAGSGIHVSGQGKIAALPNIVSFSTGVVTTAETAEGASQKNAEAMENVLRSLRNLGIEDKDIKTQTVSVWPEYDYGLRDEARRELPLIIGYRAENRVSATIRENGW